MENTSLANFEGFAAEEIINVNSSYCSMRVESEEDKIKLYNISNSPDFRLSEMIGKTILLKDIYFESVNLLDKETGELTVAPRIVLIDSEGKGYQCVSTGIYSAIKKLIGVFGKPTWTNPIKVEVKQITSGIYKVMTLSAVL